MAFWYNRRTGQVVSSKSPAFDVSERMGPYESAELARNAYLVAAVRNAAADADERAWREADDDDFDRENAEWKENW